MDDLIQWAQRWGVPEKALMELYVLPAPVGGGMPPGEESEAAVTARVRLEASQAGVTLFRNNVGVAQDPRGNIIRFGLANDSKAINTQFKSSDLIGIRPGGQFVAREVKAANWKYKGLKREKAQLGFINLINSRGGDACFATGIGTL